MAAMDAMDEPVGSRYDVVVVGAGLAGLTSGSLLARSGRRVLVVESRDRPGGHCRSLVSGDWSFDPAVHFIMGAGSVTSGDGLVTQVLEALGVADSCEFIAADPFYEARFPDLAVRVGAGREGFVDALAGAFPDEEAGVRTLLDIGDSLYDEFVRLPVEPRPLDLLQAPARFPNLFRHRKATVADLTTRHLRDPRAAAAYMALFPYIGLPPSQASFIDWAVMLSSFLGEGAFYCRGGFQRLADALAEGLTGHGGELVLGRRVHRVRVVDGQVRGVELDDGRFVSADAVVATGDVRELVSDLVGAEHFTRRYRRRIERAITSMAVLEMYLGTDLDVEALGVAHETVVWRTWDLDAAYRSMLGGDAGSVMVTIPTLTDPSIAPAGRHQVVIAGIAPSPSTASDRQRLAVDYLAAAETVLPGLAEHLVHVTGPRGEPTSEMPPPLHHIPDIYGWAATPSQAMVDRPGQVTPIHGLTLAGHWTMPGHGVWTVVASGIRATRLVLGRHTHQGLLPLAV